MKSETKYNDLYYTPGYYVQFIDDGKSIKIPMIDIHRNITGYTFISMEDIHLLHFTYSYHIYVCSSFNNKKLHQLVMGDYPKEKDVIDHIDRNPLNNRRSNLRFVTFSENARNCSKLETATSKYFGVYHNNDSGKYRAWITLDSKTIALGTHDNEIDAAKTYDAHSLMRDLGCPNNSLSSEEITMIKSGIMPEKYQIKSRKDPKLRGLPTNISLRPSGSYRVALRRKGVNFEKIVKTLEEAIELKRLKLGQYADYEKDLEELRISKIPRDENGHAYVIVNIKSTQENIKCIMDDETWPEISKTTWRTNPYGYPLRKINGVSLSMHRLIWTKFIGEIPKGKTIDHINRNKLDNRLCNLRLADKRTQMHNRDKLQSIFHHYRGVRLVSRRFKVHINKTSYEIYDVLEHAALRANEIYRELYGDECHLNSIDLTKTTTFDNLVPDNEITKELVMRIKSIKDLKYIIRRKQLNMGKSPTKNDVNSKIKLSDIKRSTFKHYKKLVINILFTK